MVKQKAESREGMVVSTMALPADLHRSLQFAALEDNAAAAEIVRRAVAEYLDRRRSKGRKVKRG